MSNLASELEVPLVEIVIPVRNEQRKLADHVTRLVDYLDSGLPCAWQVTIADKGSTDGTWSIAQELAGAHPGLVRAVHLDRPGRGRALHTVWSASDAEIVGYLDVDLSTDLRALPALLAPLLRVGFSDAQCGFKALRADAARALLPLVEDRFWFFDTELLVLAERGGLRITEVPVDWVDDTDSRVRIIATARADLRGIARLRYGLLTHAIKLPVPALARPGSRTSAEGPDEHHRRHRAGLCRPPGARAARTAA